MRTASVPNGSKRGPQQASASQASVTHLEHWLRTYDKDVFYKEVLSFHLKNVSQLEDIKV